MESIAVAKALGYDWDDVISMGVEPGMVIIVTSDGERHEHEWPVR